MPKNRQFGFSLLELLVVVAIIGVFAGTLVLSTNITGQDRQLEREALRLQGLLQLLREEALIQSRDYGLEFCENGYRFFTYDHQQLVWVLPPNEQMFTEHLLEPPLRVSMVLDARELVLEEEFEQAFEPELIGEPQLLVLSTGEVSPFEVSFYRDLNDGRFALVGGVDGSLEVTRDGFDTR